MAQQFRILAALNRIRFNSITYMEIHKNVKLQFQVSNTLAWHLQAPGTMWQIDMHAGKISIQINIVFFI